MNTVKPSAKGAHSARLRWRRQAREVPRTRGTVSRERPRAAGSAVCASREILTGLQSESQPRPRRPGPRSAPAWAGCPGSRVHCSSPRARRQVRRPRGRPSCCGSRRWEQPLRGLKLFFRRLQTRSGNKVSRKYVLKTKKLPLRLPERSGTRHCRLCWFSWRGFLVARSSSGKLRSWGAGWAVQARRPSGRSWGLGLPSLFYGTVLDGGVFMGRAGLRLAHGSLVGVFPLVWCVAVPTPFLVLSRGTASPEVAHSISSWKGESWCSLCHHLCPSLFSYSK